VHIKSLFYYPVKSLAGISTPVLRLNEKGPLHDRKWALIDKNQRNITQLTHPALSLIKVQVDHEKLGFSAPGMESISLAHTPTEIRRQVTIAQKSCETLTLSPLFGEWFSEFLSSPTEIVLISSEKKTNLRTDYALAGESLLNFPDDSPFHVTYEGSLDELNQDLERRVDMNRFRPNIVISGHEPAWVEDTWLKIRIGAIPFYVNRPCVRCLMVNVNQELGKLESKEVTKALLRERKFGNKTVFGQYLIHQKPGSLYEGDALSVVESFHGDLTERL
jgi:uncharacterized protein YcbX